MAVARRHPAQGRTHLERQQPAGRQARHGLLEKHGDYVKRARDYHAKEARLRTLRRKAAERNEDEFYFAMVHGETRRGVHVAKRGGGEGGNESRGAMDAATVGLLKSQDLGYIKTLRQAGLKKIKRLQESMHLPAGRLQDQPKKHISFLDTKAEYDRFVPPKAKPAASGSLADPALVKELALRILRDEQLALVESELQTQKDAMAKGRKQLLPRDESGVKKWKLKAERQK